MASGYAPLRIVFLWHQHQPYYKDFESGKYVLPWVRLHGTKDYLDMVRILDDFPKIKQTFNLVPSLIDQIDDYVRGTAVDRHMELSLKDPGALSESERTEIVSTFFSANRETMIKPHARYYQIHEKLMLDRQEPARAAATLSQDELIDLTVWSNLAWIDPMFRSQEPIARLIAKRQHFDLQDRKDLFDFQRKIMAEIIPAHREAVNRGQIEVSFSPYYHPILPLLIDTELAREALPRINLPGERFTHPEDAHKQIQMACELYEDLFGRSLVGMWPSEGSVAEALLPILADHGIRWVATDEEVYAASARRAPSNNSVDGSVTKSFHHPFIMRRDFGEIGILFRDHGLSDRIGFVYSGWEPEKAAADFIKQLDNIRKQIPQDRIDQFVIPIILDGENAWEYYRNDGHDFLRALYTALSENEDYATVTVSEAFSQPDALRELPYLFAGSWINHNYRVWIGHDEDNRAWDYLKAARDALVEYESANPDADPDILASAWKEMYVAEGSDWCWWYGDEHSSDQDDVFDSLFRSHLRAVYSLIDQDPPKELLEPIRGVTGQAGLDQPIDMITPEIDGNVTHFYEWHDAGMFDCTKAGSAMHRAVNVVRMMYFGFDNENLYLRFDLFTGASEEEAKDFDFRVTILGEKEIVLGLSARDDALMYVRAKPEDAYEDVTFPGSVAVDKVLELRLPRSAIEMDRDFAIRFCVEVQKRGEAIERWPNYDYIHTNMPTEDRSTFWNV